MFTSRCWSVLRDLLTFKPASSISRRRRRVTGMSATESTSAARSRKGSKESIQMVAITVIVHAMMVFNQRGKVFLCMPGSCFMAQHCSLALEEIRLISLWNDGELMVLPITSVCYVEVHFQFHIPGMQWTEKKWSETRIKHPSNASQLNNWIGEG